MKKSPIYGLCSMSHETTAPEIRRFKKVGQSTAMVQMKVTDEQQVDFAGYSDIEERQGCFACHSWVDAAVQHNLLPFVLEHNTRSTDLLAGSERLNYQLVALLRRYVCSPPFRCADRAGRHHTYSAAGEKVLKLILYTKTQFLRKNK